MFGELLDALFQLLVMPETNGIARAFFAMFCFVLSWAYVPAVLNNAPFLGEEKAGRAALRAIVSLCVIAALTYAGYSSIGLLAAR